MIIQFSVTNFLSFKDTATLNLSAVPSFEEHADTQLIKINESNNLLRASAIFGANASGKSNFIKAVSFMKAFIKFSFSNALQDNDEINIKPFSLNTKTENEPSEFEMIFSIDEIIYRYGFVASKNEIIEEYLYNTKERETLLFERDYQKIKINKSSFAEGNSFTKNARPNVLFLSLVAQLNGEVSNSIIHWFNNLNTISGIQDKSYKKFTIDKLGSDKTFRKWVGGFVKFLEIEKISSEESTNDAIVIPKSDDEHINSLLEAINEKNKEKKTRMLVTWHRKYDENNLMVDTIPFVLQNQESEGTKKFIYLLGPWYDTIVNNKVLIIDELDSRLHTLLTRKLIEYFSLHKESTGQIIFALHDTNLLDKDIFRRDQVWFVEKDQYGASDLYSLADYKSVRVRASTNFEKHYIEGKYGAIPYFGDLSKLNDLINVKEEEQ
jgi:AAA15 family ATPase/GTPase